MDLQTIGERIEACHYKTAWQYMDDMRLMFSNACYFNRPGSYHHRYAQRVEAWWTPRMEAMMVETLAHHRYCCGKYRQLSAEIFRCRAATCFIQHGASYFRYNIDVDNSVVYCVVRCTAVGQRLTLKAAHRKPSTLIPPSSRKASPRASFLQNHFHKLDDKFTIQKYPGDTSEEITLTKDIFSKAKHNEDLTPERVSRSLGRRVFAGAACLAFAHACQIISTFVFSLHIYQFVTCTRCGRDDHEVCVLHVPYTGEVYVCLSCRVQAGECQDPVQAAADACRQCGCRKNGIVADDLLKDPSDQVVDELVGSKRPHKVPGMLSSLKAEKDDPDNAVGMHMHGRPPPQTPPLATNIKRRLCKSCRFPQPPSSHRARGKGSG